MVVRVGPTLLQGRLLPLKGLDLLLPRRGSTSERSSSSTREAEAGPASERRVSVELQGSGAVRDAMGEEREGVGLARNDTDEIGVDDGGEDRLGGEGEDREGEVEKVKVRRRRGGGQEQGREDVGGALEGD